MTGPNRSRTLRAARRRLTAVTTIAALGLLSACGGGDDNGNTTSTPQVLTPRTCDLASFADLKLENAKVLAAEVRPAGSSNIPGTTTPGGSLPEYCKINAEASSGPGSLIKFEMWIPMGAAWNGKLVTTGNGAYNNTLMFGDMGYSLGLGFAVLGGDTGHQVQADANDLFWQVGHPERLVDWGIKSIHTITVSGKQILAHLKAKAASRSYFYGCSTGGHQGYNQAQRYPEDFDGIAAGAPGNNRVALNADFLWRYRVARTERTTNLVLTPAKTQMIAAASIAACDPIDGVVDGLITDPRQCTSATFNVDSLLCTGAETPTCLTAPQLAAAKLIYQGPKNPRTGAIIYPGPLVGSEAAWPSRWGGALPDRVDAFRLWVFGNPTYDYWSFDFDRDMAYAVAKIGDVVDANSADLAAFKARGAKMIAYQGWADAVVSALDTISYYDRVKALQGSQAETDKFYRLFMAPGLSHCFGGNGPINFGQIGQGAPNPTPENDVLLALDRWIETGVAPDTIIASKVTAGVVTQTRPLCVHPKKAVYKGSGNTNEAANFTCS